MSYSNFLSDLLQNEALHSLPAIYHRVRNIPYGSTGNRNPRMVAELNVGSCSGKHILLRDLVRTAGYHAEIITMFTYFNESTPTHDSFPAELKEISANHRVPDFHHYVRVQTPAGPLNLDATWHDQMIPFGFSVNNNWQGDGDTQLASVPERKYPNQENLIIFKKQLIETLSEIDRTIRARYFSLVTNWIAALP